MSVEWHGSLPGLFGAASQREARRTSTRICQRGTDRMHEVAAANTPVRTGNLRTAWYQTPVHPTATARGATGVEASIRNDVDYAPFVENGTGKWGPKHAPYEIRPKDPDGVLAWRDPATGKWVYAKRVMHPGSPGNHMTQIAAHVVEGEVEGGLAHGPLEDFARRAEANGEHGR